jgi:putative Mn2+ efflux pump MntP
MTAFALSIDNLVVGFALGVYNVSVFEAAVVMGVVSVLLSLLGLELGSRLGKRVEAWSEELGGGVLVLIGLALAFGLLR